jgi:hypothetical protein
VRLTNSWLPALDLGIEIAQDNYEKAFPLKAGLHLFCKCEGYVDEAKQVYDKVWDQIIMASSCQAQAFTGDR